MPSAAPRLTLEDQFCFTLYSASMAVGRTYKPLLDMLGITYPQYLVLNALWERDALSVGGIADTLALESSTITPLVRRLVAAGLVDRQRNELNDRQVLVSLTEAGRQMQERCACLGATLVSASGLSLDRLLHVAREVRTIRDALKTHLRKQERRSGIVDWPAA